MDLKMKYLWIHSALFILPYQGKLPPGSFWVVKSVRSWAGTRCARPSQTCVRHHRHHYVSESPELEVSLVISLRTQALSYTDAFNHSILYSFFQPRQESGTNNIFLLLSLSLSVGYSVQTTYKSKPELRRSPWALASGQLAHRPSLPTHTHGFDATVDAP